MFNKPRPNTLAERIVKSYLTEFDYPEKIAEADVRRELHCALNDAIQQNRLSFRGFKIRSQIKDLVNCALVERGYYQDTFYDIYWR